MIPVVTVNYLAILVSTIVGFVIGALWYGPVFGKSWMALMKLTKKDMNAAKKKGMAKGMAAMFVSLFVMECVFAHVLKYAQATTIMDGLTGAVWVWLGFIATVMIGSILWENRPVKLYAINVSHYLAVLLVSGAILVSWA